MRHKSDISERFAPFNPYFVATPPLRRRVTCKGFSYTKNEYNLFYRKLHAEYFYIRQFFRKKTNIYRESMKIVSRAHLTIFYVKEAFHPKN